MDTPKFQIDEEDLADLVPDMGYCYATNKITVEGLAVGMMYREESDDEDDSGWRFFSGLETQEYFDDEDNTMAYDVNTIANYDTSIIPYLNSPVNTELVRIDRSEKFKKIED
jgi:hypothetical protein